MLCRGKTDKSIIHPLVQGQLKEATASTKVGAKCLGVVARA